MLGFLRGLLGATNAVETVANIFVPNAEKQAVRDAEYGKKALAQYAAEFGYVANRTWFDSLADGLNRLVRPVIVYMLTALLVLAVVNPEVANLIQDGISNMSNGFWTTYSLVLAFYFGGRMQVKSQEWRSKK